MSQQTTSEATPNATSSPALGSGATRSAKRAGRTTGKSGQAAARASLSAQQAKERGLLTSGTFGRTGTSSSSSDSLQSSLESRLRARTALLGSTLYKLTWKERITPAQRSICALRASVLRTSGKGLGSWPTPRANDAEKRGKVADDPRNGLVTAANLAGWPTPTTRDHKDGTVESCKNVPINALLGRAVHLAGWNSPAAGDGNGGKRPHPDTTMTGKHPSGRKVNMGLASQVHIGFINTEPARLTDSGELLTGSSAGMESGGQLNPAHSRWLMGLPPEWDDCAPTVTRSSRRSRKPS